MKKLRMSLDDLRVDSFTTDDESSAGPGTVFAHDSEACRKFPTDLYRETQQNSCFVASCQNVSCFACSAQISCWGCNTPLCPPIPIDRTSPTFNHGCAEH